MIQRAEEIEIINGRPLRVRSRTHYAQGLWSPILPHLPHYPRICLGAASGQPRVTEHKDPSRLANHIILPASLITCRKSEDSICHVLLVLVHSFSDKEKLYTVSVVKRNTFIQDYFNSSSKQCNNLHKVSYQVSKQLDIAFIFPGIRCVVIEVSYLHGIVS